MKIECSCGKFVESVHLMLVDKLGFTEWTVALVCITREIDGIYSNSVLVYPNSVLVSLNSSRIVGVNFRDMGVHVGMILACRNRVGSACIVSIGWKV